MLSPEEIKTQKAYDLLAANRNCYAGNPETWRNEYEFLKQLLPTGKVLDLGCGAGRDALLFGSSFQYCGIDLSSPMLEQAKIAAPDKHFVLGDFYRLPFANKSFDVCWAAASLLHMPKHNITKALVEISRATKLLFFIALKEGSGEKFVAEKNNPNVSRFFSFWQLSELQDTLEANSFFVITLARKVIADTTWIISTTRVK